LIHRTGEGLWYNPKRNGDGNTEEDRVPEAEVRMVEGMYADTKSRMLCGL